MGGAWKSRHFWALKWRAKRVHLSPKKFCFNDYIDNVNAIWKVSGNLCSSTAAVKAGRGGGGPRGDDGLAAAAAWQTEVYGRRADSWPYGCPQPVRRSRRPSVSLRQAFLLWSTCCMIRCTLILVVAGLCLCFNGCWLPWIIPVQRTSALVCCVFLRVSTAICQHKARFLKMPTVWKIRTFLRHRLPWAQFSRMSRTLVFHAAHAASIILLCRKKTVGSSYWLGPRGACGFKRYEFPTVENCENFQWTVCVPVAKTGLPCKRTLDQKMQNIQLLTVTSQISLQPWSWLRNLPSYSLLYVKIFVQIWNWRISSTRWWFEHSRPPRLVRTRPGSDSCGMQTASSAACGPRGCTTGTGQCEVSICTTRAAMWRTCPKKSRTGSRGGRKWWRPWPNDARLWTRVWH